MPEHYKRRLLVEPIIIYIAYAESSKIGPQIHTITFRAEAPSFYYQNLKDRSSGGWRKDRIFNHGYASTPAEAWNKYIQNQQRYIAQDEPRLAKAKEGLRLALQEQLILKRSDTHMLAIDPISGQRYLIPKEMSHAFEAWCTSMGEVADIMDERYNGFREYKLI